MMRRNYLWGLLLATFAAMGLSAAPAIAAGSGTGSGTEGAAQGNGASGSSRSQWSVPELNDKTYKYWVDFVRPNREELKWKDVGWRTDLWEAVQEAKQLERPIFLWTMNGHPMGCT